MPGVVGEKGLCPVCHGLFRLTGSGLLYRHGGKVRGGECAGSAQAPGASVVDLAGITEPGVASISADPCRSASVSQGTDFGFLMARDRPRLVDHIPKGARATCRGLLSSILSSITSSPDDVLKWRALLLFGRDVLAKPARGGRRHNITSHIKRQADNFCGSAEVTPKQKMPRQDFGGRGVCQNRAG